MDHRLDDGPRAIFGGSFRFENSRSHKDPVGAQGPIIRAASAGVAMPRRRQNSTTENPTRCPGFLQQGQGHAQFPRPWRPGPRQSISLQFPGFPRDGPHVPHGPPPRCPVPASPLVRSMQAPSLMRRRPSPRFRAPQTKGTAKRVLVHVVLFIGPGSGPRSRRYNPPRWPSRIRASRKWPMRTLAITGMVTVLHDAPQ